MKKKYSFSWVCFMEEVSFLGIACFYALRVSDVCMTCCHFQSDIRLYDAEGRISALRYGEPPQIS
jgi:hypothetical protein